MMEKGNTMLQFFVDGSGKSDRQSRYLTFAGLMARDQVWGAFELRWRGVLDRYSVPYSHMKELLRGKHHFHGWDDSTKRNFVTALYNTVTHEDRSALIATSLTIDLDAYRTLATHPTVKPAEAVCVDYGLSTLFKHPDFPGGCEVYFDQGESFERYLQKTWLRWKSDPKSWAYCIRTVKNLDSKSSIPLQAADLLAWVGNRHYNSEPNAVDFWRFGLFSSIIMLPHYCALYGVDELREHPKFFAWDGM